uniref:F-box domain-containing protein n=1 Tax=Glossina pallidipes TaxID=7398 RepID=A0A1B0AC78_GLOPL
MNIMNKFSGISGTDYLLPGLPNEVWIKAFAYSSYGNIQQVKLVDRHWSRLSNSSELQRKTKLIVTVRNVENICEIVERRTKPLDSLQFENVKIHSVEKLEHILKVFGYLGS